MPPRQVRWGEGVEGGVRWGDDFLSPGGCRVTAAQDGYNSSLLLREVRWGGVAPAGRGLGAAELRGPGPKLTGAVALGR